MKFVKSRPPPTLSRKSALMQMEKLNVEYLGSRQNSKISQSKGPMMAATQAKHARRASAGLVETSSIGSVSKNAFWLLQPHVQGGIPHSSNNSLRPKGHAPIVHMNNRINQQKRNTKSSYFNKAQHSTYDFRNTRNKLSSISMGRVSTQDDYSQ